MAICKRKVRNGDPSGQFSGITDHPVGSCSSTSRSSIRSCIVFPTRMANLGKEIKKSTM
ncbi:unnamed protein product [Schistosoma curassoni]|uniref:Uncharacterized protein n=1 Tax=Schistosoma curassoni TaxID=6186 RepID=A0A183KAK3_9TREM|nr:unnamed protein product [Schistosoma curassoni]